MRLSNATQLSTRYWGLGDPMAVAIDVKELETVGKGSFSP